MLDGKSDDLCLSQFASFTFIENPNTTSDEDSYTIDDFDRGYKISFYGDSPDTKAD